MSQSSQPYIAVDSARIACAAVEAFLNARAEALGVPPVEFVQAVIEMLQTRHSVTHPPPKGG